MLILPGTGDRYSSEQTTVPDAQRFHSSPARHVNQPGGGMSPRASQTGKDLTMTRTRFV